MKNLPAYSLREGESDRHHFFNAAWDTTFLTSDRLWNMAVYPSTRPSSFLWNWMITFLKILVWCWKPIWGCAWQSQTCKKNICSQNEENVFKMGQKQGSLNKLKILFIFFSELACNESLNCYVSAQMWCLEQIWFLRYGPKCSWPIRLQDF